MNPILFFDEYFSRTDVSEEWKNVTRKWLAWYQKKGDTVVGISPAGIVVADSPKKTEVLVFYRQWLVDVWDRVYYKRPKKGNTLDLPF